MSFKDRCRLIKLIHIGKKKLDLDDEVYRALLLGVTGASSCRDCSLPELEQILAAMKKLGFRPKHLPVKPLQRGRFCTEAQRSYIKGLWELASREKTERSLRSMIKRIAGVDDLRFLTKPGASKVILALRDIAQKAKFNP